jgi:predicted  nucleic acid-binding Zn-ribbon protein
LSVLDELIETISKIRQNRETNASAVKEQKILVENEIQELRTKIDKHLEFSRTVTSLQSL